MLYSIRSERLLMEEIDYSLLFRWFVGMNLDEEVWDPTSFTKNRERLLDAEVAREFLSRIVKQAREKGWASDEHFTVDGTLIEAWATLKSFQRKDRSQNGPPDDPGNPTVNSAKRVSNFSGEIDGRPVAEYIAENSGDNCPRTSSTTLRIARSG
jgi:hypothetical protein